ncbi:uncharacterized protein [Dermacentor andersoni]|uniref:uncharacterized protein n=1 Tax=Dermacentor andersoni TaxID=34620 RepID=UPI0024177256|nr:uncharacterized protein LOC126517632 [Dermacentor andersoni]
MSESSQSLVTKPAPERLSIHWDSLNIPCTKKDGGSCSLIKHRHDLNKVLRGACLELGEDGRGESRGAVLIECVQSHACGFAARVPERVSCVERALDLAERLLAEHRCITAITFRVIWLGRASMRSAINRNRFLKSITICPVNLLSPHDDAILLEMLNPMPQRRNVALKVNDFGEEWGVDVPVPGRSLGLGMDHVTTLDVSEVYMSDTLACWLIRELTENKSITGLGVSHSVFPYRDEASNALFARYLAKEDCALRKLTLKYTDIYRRGLDLALREIVDALCKMSTLEELNADIVVAPVRFMSTVTLFAEVITRSGTLRRLRLPSTTCECLATLKNSTLQLPDPQAAKCMESLCQGLQKQSSTLSRLCIDMRIFGEAECHSFFHAVADNKALKTVVVDTLPCIDGLDRVSRTIRKRGLNDRVVVKGQCAHDNTRQLQQCPQICNATVDTVMGTANVLHLFIPSLRVVSGCDHITSLRVQCLGCGINEYSALTACIRGSTALTEVDIDMNPAWILGTSPELREVEGELVSALASNVKLARVNLKGFQLSYDDMNVLARAASRSLSLIEFTLSSACFLYNSDDRISCPLHETQAFLEASDHKDGALADIMEVARKNASAVLDAADFVLGEQSGVEGARAVELMRDHPRLLEMVMEGADVTKAEAKERIRSALLHVRSSTIDEFMTMTGIVKEAVECLSHPGARRLQLADIGHDCWLHIRSFLKIADVVSR